MATQVKPAPIQLSIETPADLETAWAALTDPDRVTEWPARPKVRVRQERQQGVRRRDPLVARGRGDAAAPRQEHDGVE